MVCKKCGQLLKDGAMVCEYCGTEISYYRSNAGLQGRRQGKQAPQPQQKQDLPEYDPDARKTQEMPQEEEKQPQLITRNVRLDDKELEAIMEREFGPVKRPLYRRLPTDPPRKRSPSVPPSARPSSWTATTSFSPGRIWRR